MGIWKKNTEIYTDLSEVDQFIKDSLKSNQRTLTTAMDELLAAGGKRIRPALVLLSGFFGQYDKKKLIPLASAIEILHMATLVHDDIIDEAKCRRGRPTVQNKWGSDIAVFTGDFLFTKAFLVITQKTSADNMSRIAQAIKAICQGEIDQYESRFKGNVSRRHYLKRIARKTALLFALSCYVGAEESHCNAKIRRHLTQFGREFGMAFQITDDLLDFSGNQDEVGKPLLSDFAQGVYTLPVIYTLENPTYAPKLSQMLGRQDLGDQEIVQLMNWVNESGGIEYSRNLATRFLNRAKTHLDALPDIPAKNALRELLDELIERRY